MDFEVWTHTQSFFYMDFRLCPIKALHLDLQPVLTGDNCLTSPVSWSVSAEPICIIWNK